MGHILLVEHHELAVVFREHMDYWVGLGCGYIGLEISHGSVRNGLSRVSLLYAP